MLKGFDKIMNEHREKDNALSFSWLNPKYDKILWMMRQNDRPGWPWSLGIKYDKILGRLREFDGLGVPYALNFDGINDYITNSPTTPFTQRDRFQPFTFFVSLSAASWAGNNAIYSSRNWTFPGLIIRNNNTGGLVVSFGGQLVSHIIRIASVWAIPLWKHTLQVTYDWSSLASWVSMYLDWVLITSSISADNLSSSIINTHNACFISRDFSWSWLLGDFDWKVRRLSFVDYVKSPTEILNDHNAEIQSSWSWNYLLAIDLNRTSWLTFPSNDPAMLIMDVFWQPSWDWVVW